MTLQGNLDYICKTTQTPGLALIYNAEKDNGRIYCSGYCSREQSLANQINKDTRFQLASISKFITACLVHELSHHGHLQLNEIVQLRRNGILMSCSIENLLSNKGGFAANSTGFLGASPNSNLKHEEKNIESLCVKAYKHSLSGNYNYNGCNFWLLQLWMENKLKISYESLLKQYICEPMKLENTTTASPCKGIPIALGHDTEGNELQNGWRQFKQVEAAAGIWSSPEDMRRLMQVLLSKRSNGSKQKPKVRIEDLIINRKSGYQHGILMKSDLHGIKLFHSGINPGYYAFLAVDLVERSSQILLSNRQNGEALKKTIITIR